MKKKIVIIVLMLGVLLIMPDFVYSGWGPTTDDFGPIVIAGGHPWGEEPHSTYSVNVPPSYRPGAGGGLPNMPGVSAFTNFAIKFYYNYVIKAIRTGQSAIRYNHKSD